MSVSKDKGFHGLELLRFLCALAVVVWHYQQFFLQGGQMIPGYSRDAQPFYGFFYVPYNWGAYAVQIFWALSGFIFFWKYAQPVHERRIGPREFFVLRFSRLYPLHLLTLLVVAALQAVYLASHQEAFIYLFNDIRHFVLNLFLASDWVFHKGLSFNGPIWSISVEVLAYASFFALARRMRFTGRRLAMIIVGLIVARMALPWVKDIVLCHLYFFVGGAVHLLATRRGARPLADTGIAMALAAVFVMANWLTDGKFHTFTVIFVAIGLIFLFLQVGTALPSRRLRGAFVFMGNTTYSSYLIHFPLQLAAVIVVDSLGLSRALFLEPWAFLAYMAVVFVLSELCFLMFEYPIQEWIRARFRRVPTEGAAPLPAKSEASS